MRTLTHILRVLLGLTFLVFDMNYFFNFMPIPQPSAEGAAMMGALMETGYFMTFLKLSETLCGLLLVFNLFVPLALIVLAPIILNIFLFHMFLDPQGIPLATYLVLLEVFLAVAYRSYFTRLFEPKAKIGFARSPVLTTSSQQ